MSIFFHFETQLPQQQLISSIVSFATDQIIG